MLDALVYQPIVFPVPSVAARFEELFLVRNHKQINININTPHNHKEFISPVDVAHDSKARHRTCEVVAMKIKIANTREVAQLSWYWSLAS